ncbi:MAG TPA: FAD-binding oxidoreductase [Thermoplasmata archaeon]|nr:FAD-binding oxidoreductase [Thermoplasmata archaeon]
MANRLDYTYRRLVNLFGPDRVRRDPFETFVYSHDFAAIPKLADAQFKFRPDFVALPRTTEEVVRLVRLQREVGLPLVPRGGGTGLYGGAVPNRGGIVVDFRRMGRVVRIDPGTRTMIVEPGCTWQDAYDRAWAAGLFLPVTPNFSLGSTVGGWINSGGVGIGATKYGTARDLLLNLEVVLADGTTVQTGMDRLDLGASHLNLGPLLWGSEGTLGLVTRATLRLYPRPDEIRPLAYAFESLEDAVPALRALAALPVTPYHVALVDPSHLEFLKAVRWESPEPSAIAVVALEGAKDEVAEGEKLVDAAMAAEDAGKMAAETARGLWADRTYQYPMRRIAQGLVICEGVVPLGKLSEALKKTRELRSSLRMEVGIHAAMVDANSVALYPYFLDDEASPLPPARLGFVVKWRDMVMDLDGHPMGVGLFMVFNVPRMHGNASRFFKPIKEAFDPMDRINAGKMHEIRTRFGFPGLRRVPLAVAALPFKVLGALKSITPINDRFVRKYEARGGKR